ncbi:hypothetical protein ABH15_07015 [Methanoculleus taiwanensis]|uniref:Methionine synthase n=1 Tax=Methanoculleus taiwanensis TaxID=1550565 RepID=A0A498H1P0_9EURY|nr:hypothetical protein [Methanoculleus taiwanensis]RXE55950.1 hypothetical protein ABH15_07015 [Methanoculleus taiwanensis]
MATMLPQMDLHATGIGALPHLDPDAACRSVLAAFPRVPYAPTLPNRGLLERIVFCDSEHLPGRVLADERLTVDTSGSHAPAMEQILLDYLEGNAAPYAVGEAYGSAFHRMLSFDLSDVLVFKFQLTGSVTFGMQVVDERKRPIHYDPEYADVLNKMIALRAKWCETVMRERTGAKRTLIVLDEPYLAALGSSVVPVDEEVVRSSVSDAAGLLEGSLGIHCCSNTDWGFLMSLEPAVISFDAYQHAREFLLYADDLAAYLEAGGVIAWGIVPSEPHLYAAESLDALFDRFMQIRSKVTDLVGDRLFNERSLITPTCGIRLADVPDAEAIMQTAAELSRRAREEAA